MLRVPVPILSIRGVARNPQVRLPLHPIAISLSPALRALLSALGADIISRPEGRGKMLKPVITGERIIASGGAAPAAEPLVLV